MASTRPKTIEQVLKESGWKVETGDEAPRKLKQEEIDMIVSWFQQENTNYTWALSMDPVIAEETLNEIRRVIRQELEVIVLTPLAIPSMISEINKRFAKARIQPGTTAGLTAGEAISQPVMQVALKSFHFAGRGLNISFGIGTIQELVSARHKREILLSEIHFLDKDLSYMDVFKKRGSIVGLTVKQLLVGEPVVESYPNYFINEYVAGKEGVTARDIETQFRMRQRVRDDVLPWWYSLYRINHLVPPETSYFMRLHLATDVMYYHRVTPDKICSKLTQHFNNSIVCIPSPYQEGMIDIYPIRDTMFKQLTKAFKTEEDIKTLELIENSSFTFAEGMNITLDLVYLHQIIGDKLGEVYVQGIPAITKYVPVLSDVTSCILREVSFLNSFTEKERLAAMYNEGKEQFELWERSWYIHLDTTKMVQRGIPVSRVVSMFEGLDIPIQYETLSNEDGGTYEIPYGIDQGVLIVIMPIDKARRSPLRYIADLKQEAEERETKGLAEALLTGSPINEPYSDRVFRLTKYVYAQAIGSDLKSLYRRDDVDPYSTYSNDIMEIMSLLSVEAARNVYVMDFMKTIEHVGSSIDIRHIELLADYIFWKAKYLGINYHGNSGRAYLAFMDMMVTERAQDVISSEALTGSTQHTDSASAAIILGQQPHIGTTSFDVLSDEEKAKQLEDEKEMRAFMGHIDRPYRSIFSKVFQRDIMRSVEGLSGLDEYARKSLEKMANNMNVKLPSLTDYSTMDRSISHTQTGNKPPTTIVQSKGKTIESSDTLFDKLIEEPKDEEEYPVLVPDRVDLIHSAPIDIDILAGAKAVLNKDLLYRLSTQEDRYITSKEYKRDVIEKTPLELAEVLMNIYRKSRKA